MLDFIISSSSITSQAPPATAYTLRRFPIHRPANMVLRMSDGIRFERRIPHVGTYRRELNASIERLYENTLDWEHLPYLHRCSFRRIELVEAVGDRWRAWVWPQARKESARIMIELALDRACRRWITTTIEGSGAGTEIWTHAFAVGERRCDVVVDFFAPDTTPETAPGLGKFYVGLYKRLYDEDEAMMVERQLQLDRAHEHDTPGPEDRLSLGQLDDVRRRLPLTVEFGGRRFRVVEADGELLVHAAVCPHLLGPLGEGTVRDGIVECPWHGYRFDLRMLECVSGANCRLSPSPDVSIDAATSEVILTPPRSPRP